MPRPLRPQHEDMDLILTAVALLVIAVTPVLVREVRLDGLGSRPAPPSHADGPAGTTPTPGVAR